LFAATSGSAQGYGLHAQVSLGSLSPINVPYAPNPPASVNSTGSSANQALSLALGIDAGLLGKPVSISTGVVKGNSQATLNGYDTDTVTATGEVDNTNIAVSALIPVLGITADVLQSTAQATCSAGTAVMSGNSVITNLKINVLGLPVSVPVSTAPNTSLNVPLVGLSVVLNEQIAHANQISVNALHVSLSNYLLSAVLGTLNLDIALGSASASMQSACVAAPALTLSKVADAIFVRGSNGSYTFTVTNIGGASAQAGLTLTDVLPVGISFVSSSGSGWSCTPGVLTGSGQTVTCTNSTTALAPGATSALHMVVGVAATAPNPVVNTAVVGNPDQPPPGDCASANPSNGCATTTTTVQSALLPTLVLTKSASGAFVRGSIGTYLFTLTNTGLGAATGPMIVTDTLPTGMGYSGVSGNGWSCSSAAQTVTCSNPAGLASLGTSSLTLAVTIAANTAATVVNTASVGSSNDPAPTCVSGAATLGCATATTPVSDAPAQSLQLQLSSSPFFVRGGVNNLYTYTITNTGNVAALAPISLVSAMSNQVTFGSIVASSNNLSDWLCPNNAFPCVYSQPLAAGQTMTVTVQVNVGQSAPSQVRNDAGVGNPQQPTPLSCGVVISAQCASMTTPVQNATSPHLTLTKTANGSFVRGASGSYTLAVSNSGTAATTGLLAITDTLPSGLTYTGFSGSGWACSATSQVVTCTTAAALAPGATNQVTLNVAIAANAPSPETNTAVVGSDNDPAPDCSAQQVDGCATTTTPVNDPPVEGSPHLTLTKTANGSFVRGGTGSYSLVATNSGNAATTGVLTLVDTLPAGLTYSSASGTGWSCSASGQIVTCTNAAILGAGASSEVVISVAIASSAANTITNAAVVGTPNDPPPTCMPPVDGCATTTTPVSDPPPQGQPHLVLSKTANGSFVRGATGSYTLTVSNTGSVASTAPLTLIDTLPTGLSYSSASGTGWTCSASGQVVTCSNASSLPAGASSQVALTVAIAANTSSPTVNNAVVGTPTQPPPSCMPPVDGCATTTTPVNDPPPQGQPHLTLTKVANGSFVAGGNASYTLTVRNTGSVSASGPITLIDNLPAGLSYIDSRGSDSGWDCAVSGATVTCTTSSALLAGAASSVQLNVAIAANASGSVTNNASVGTPTEPPPSCTTLVDGCAITTTPVIIGPQNGQPILALSKSHSGNFKVGTPGIYSLTLRNIGTAATVGALNVEDQLPNGMEFVTATSSDPSWQCAGIADVQCVATNLVLQPGQRTTIFMTVNVNFDALGNVINRADASGGGLAPVDCTKTPSSPACATDPTEVDATPPPVSAAQAVGPFPAPMNNPVALLVLALTLPWLARRMLVRAARGRAG
jgi:uncharacterized repeat protein (TIGR01451 family)